MKNQHLDFPVSAAAVRLHAREFQEQDFLAAAPDPAANDDRARSVATQRTDATDSARQGHAVYQYPSLAGERLCTLARWTAVCLAIGVAVAVVMSWLMRPDVQRVTWVDAAGSAVHGIHR